MKTRKVFAAFLALMLLMGLSTVAYAAGSDSTHTAMGSETIGVEGSYSGSDTAATVYSVKIEWGEMTFTYETTGDKTWNPETHTYNFTDGDGWKATGNDVTVTNHSNAPVNVAFSFTKNTTPYKGEYTGSMSVTKRQLAAGVENKPDEADSVTSTLTLTGGLNRTVSSSTKLGEITVSLTEVTAEP